MSSSNARNLQIFTAVSSIWAIVMGFIGPFYVLQVAKLSGGMEKLGLAFSIMVLVQSATTYFAGSFSDKLGRKLFLFFTAYTDAIILFLYTIISNTYQLYILQAMLGITNGIAGTISVSFLGDLTIKEKRGRSIGKFNAIVGLSSATGLFFGGYMVKFYGLKSLFYLASVVVALSTALLFFIKEGDAEG
ncbi:MAG: MFS transporter [Thermodesulfovibrionia bacterium]|nr:MFS transporter [Thermodesulfovibrionia bacterium]